jgi:hypothetical protein
MGNVAGFKPGRGRGKVLFTLFAVFCFAAVTGCPGRKPFPAVPAASEPPAQNLPEETRLPWKAAAILKTGKNPLWFELSGDGPRLISSPEEAALIPYTPWPLSRYIAGMIPWDGDLVLAANRGGFFVLDPLAEGGAVLYSVLDPARWDLYAVSALFMYGNRPVVLLYRDAFFSAPQAPPPDPPFFVLSRDSPVPVAVKFPILDSLPENSAGNSAAWELNSLRPGRDGFWYGRRTQTGGPRPETVYFRTADLSREGEKVSSGEYRNSALPEPASAAPEYIASFLAVLAEEAPFGDGQAAVELVSPDFPAARIFSAGLQGDAEDAGILHGYYRKNPEPLVFAVDAGGRLFGVARGEAVFRFSLPPLPRGFVYTGACLAGTVLVTAWEEQEGSGIGAAGFMVMDAAVP